MLCAAYVWAVNRSTASLPMPPPPALPPRPVVPVYFRVRTFSGHPSHRPAAPPAPRGHLDQSRWPSCALRPGTWRSRGRRAGALPGSARALRRIDAESRPERDAGRHRPQGRCIGQPPADRSGPPGACSSEVLSLGCWSGPERVRLGMPPHLARLDATAVRVAYAAVRLGATVEAAGATSRAQVSARCVRDRHTLTVGAPGAALRAPQEVYARRDRPRGGPMLPSMRGAAVRNSPWPHGDLRNRR